MSNQPNVILILADDMGLGDLSCLNEGRSRTPHLDALREESVWFSRAYSASPVSAPARAALLTGRYPHRTGAVTLNMEKHPELSRIRKDETTMADVFRASGYATGLVGKWHSGMGSEYHPLARGFDEFEGFISHLDVPDYSRYKLEVQDEVHEVDDGYLTDDLSDRAVRFVRRHRDQPFFLHLAHYAPHRPLGAPQERIQPYLKRGFSQEVATIYAMIEIMDEGIGRLLAELNTLGIADNTVVIFTSDNGPDPLTEERFNHQLRGTKYTVYEGGIHVPFIVRWPAEFAPGERDHLLHFTDILPTLAELCALEFPDGLALDGVSLADVLSGEEARAPSQHFWQWNRAEPRYSHNAAVREGDWKLVRPFVTHGYIKQDPDCPSVLYNLASDPGETTDLSALHPERCAQMEADLETWCADVEQDRTRHSPIPGPACPALPDVPNILFILVDDLGWADLGCYGHPWHDTPALNSLASDGIRFTQGYAPAPICSASRSGILTGKAPARLGFEFVIKDEVIPQKAQPGQRLQTPPFTIDLPLDEKVIPAYLGEAGYNTAFFGKWHMNQHYRGYLGWRPTHGPLQRGFQHAIEDFGSHPYSYRKCGEPDPVTEPGVLPADAVTDHAIDFLRRRGTAPFFLMVSHFYVHTPVKTPCRWLLDKYEAKVPADAPNRGKRVAYAAFLETLDRYVGHLLTALDDERLRDNTLVVFMSDNGGHPEYTGHTPLRGSKWNLYEGGVRVPFLVRWPGEIPGGAVCDTPVTGCDLLPTFTELAGRPVDRAASNLDGDSLLALFRDPSATLQRDLYWHFPYYHPGDGYADVCQEIGISDFALSQTRPHSAIRRGDRKLLRFYEDSRAELYDLARDVGEQNDRSAMDSRQAAELDESLTDLLAQANARFPVPLPPE